MTEYRHGSHTIYDIQYHLVWVTKYRYHVLAGEVAVRARELIRQSCMSRDVKILKGHIAKDHVHLLVSCPPSLSVAKVVQYLKGQSASRRLAQEVTEKGVAALVTDASADERFAKAESIVFSGVRSLLAAPLLDSEGCLGMVVLSAKSRLHPFQEDDLELLMALASAAAFACSKYLCDPSGPCRAPTHELSRTPQRERHRQRPRVHGVRARVRLRPEHVAVDGAVLRGPLPHYPVRPGR